MMYSNSGQREREWSNDDRVEGGTPGKRPRRSGFDQPAPIVGYSMDLQQGGLPGPPLPAQGGMLPGSMHQGHTQADRGDVGAVGVAGGVGSVGGNMQPVGTMGSSALGLMQSSGGMMQQGRSSFGGPSSGVLAHGGPGGSGVMMAHEQQQLSAGHIGAGNVNGTSGGMAQHGSAISMMNSGPGGMSGMAVGRLQSGAVDGNAVASGVQAAIAAAQAKMQANLPGTASGGVGAGGPMGGASFGMGASGGPVCQTGGGDMRSMMGAHSGHIRGTMDAGMMGSGPSSETVMNCPSEAVGKIIGRKGETIKDIMGKSGANIQIDHNSEGPTRKITLSGAAGAVAKAGEMVKEVLREFDAMRASGGMGAGIGGPVGSQGVLYDCPSDKVGLVIGRGGETIKRLQAETGAHIHVDRETSRVTLRGTNEAIDKAKRELDDIIFSGPGRIGGFGGQGGLNTQITIPSQGQEGRLIGRGGECIKRLQSQSGARIQIDTQSHTVAISGSPDAIQRARQMCEEVISEGSNREVVPGGGAVGAVSSGYGVGQPQGGFMREMNSSHSASSHPYAGYTPPVGNSSLGFPGTTPGAFAGGPPVTGASYPGYPLHQQQMPSVYPGPGQFQPTDGYSMSSQPPVGAGPGAYGTQPHQQPGFQPHVPQQQQQHVGHGYPLHQQPHQVSGTYSMPLQQQHGGAQVSHQYSPAGVAMASGPAPSTITAPPSVASSFPAAAYEPAGATGSGLNLTPPGTMPSGWDVLTSPEGYTYYYNRNTGVSQWEKPE